MEIQQENQHDSEPETESNNSTRIEYSGPLSSPITTTNRDEHRQGILKNKRDSSSSSSKNKSARFKETNEEDNVEITLDVREDSVLVQNIIGAGDAETTAILATQQFEKSSNRPLGSQLSFRLRQLSQELKRVTSSSSKRFDVNKVDRNKSGAARALRGFKFMTQNDVASGDWAEVEKRFHDLAVNGVLPRTRICQCNGMKESNEFATELFDALARRGGIASSSTITKPQFQEFWQQITDQSFDARLQIFFHMVDKEADGRISGEEVKEIIALSASANKLSKIQERAEEYAALIMEELDPNNLGFIEVRNLEVLLLQAPTKSTNLATDSRILSKMLSQQLVPTRDDNPIKNSYKKVSYFVEDNWKRIWVMGLWIAICAGLFTWKFIQYKDRAVFDVMGYCVTTAKGAAETLKFNMALILLPVCRNTITWLRTKTKLGLVVPFDDSINFHKVIAIGIAIGVGLHGVAHLTCDFPRLLHATDEEYEPMKPFFGEERPNNYWWFVKGTEGWTGIIMVVLLSIAFTLAQPWFRRNRLNLPKTLKKLTGFNAFWYSHHLFVVVYVLLIVHGYYLYLSKQWYKKTTWMYLAVPIALYSCERLIRALRSGYKTVKILKVAFYRGNVMALKMSKPQGFKYTSGQYIFVNCPDISPFQWHPFSITSAPGDDYLSIHIRTLGDWTSQLKSVFSKVYQPASSNQSGLPRADMENGNNKPRLPRLLIDGPYGAPAQDNKNYDVLLLVGLGIGATPLISIIKDVLNNIKQQKEIEEGILDSSINKGKPFATKRAYFYWVTREQGSFEWFRCVMNEVAEYDQDRVIELYNYCTSVYEEGDARSALITMLQSLQHAKNGVDVVSDTRVKTHFARPKWRKVFKRVTVNHPGQRIGVFYCGAAGLIGELKQLAQDFSRKTTTKFDFHKENF